MGMNIENVAKALGISKKSAEALDALDGKSDKQVKQSIYDEAAKLLNAARASNGDRSVFANTEFKEEVYNALEDDLTKIMGFVRTEESANNIPKELKASVLSQKDENKTKITISEASFDKSDMQALPEGTSIDSNGVITINTNIDTTWARIIDKFYPELLKTCNGEMFGPGGAIRVLQKAMATDKTGNLDENKLNNIMKSDSIPKQMVLPEAVNGISVNKELVNLASGDGNGILSREEILATVSQD